MSVRVATPARVIQNERVKMPDFGDSPPQPPMNHNVVAPGAPVTVSHPTQRPAQAYVNGSYTKPNGRSQSELYGAGLLVALALLLGVGATCMMMRPPRAMTWAFLLLWLLVFVVVVVILAWYYRQPNRPVR